MEQGGLQAHFAAYEKCWPFPIEFDQEHNQILLTKHWFSKPIKTRNPTTNVMFTQQCEEML